MNFSERLQKIIEEDLLIEQVSNKRKVPNPIIRLIVAEVGASLPTIHHKLYQLGHAVPLREYRKPPGKASRIVAVILAAVKPFRILISGITERFRELYYYEEPAEGMKHDYEFNPEQKNSTKIIKAEEKEELKNWCAETALGVRLNEAAIQAQQLELIKIIRNR